MALEAPSQRRYRSACPGCGAPVDFRSAQSTHAVCGYCQSTVVRQGEVLSRLGKMAEVFEDHSPLQLGASGHVDGQGFAVVGRLQYQSDAGSTWTEWALALDNGETAALSEDNGAYVVTRPQLVQRALPEASHFRVGATTAIDGTSYTVASADTVWLRAAQGELSHLPPLGQHFAMVDLRSQGDARNGHLLSLDYSPALQGQPPAVSRGHTVLLDEMRLVGLKAESAREDKGRQFACPACGSPVHVGLESTKRLTCAACHSLIDLSQGVGAELMQARQHDPVQPLIALGRTGQLQGRPWQVVGFQHRMGHDPQDSNEHFGWNEYLLYNTQRGFQFLVDAEDGWSLVKPTTGVPVLGAGGQSATYVGTNYRLQYAYNAETTYVAGEFYWPVERGQRSYNRDFAAGQSLLSQEQTPREVTWSSGIRMHAKTVADAFGLQDQLAFMSRQDAAPVSVLGGGAKVVLVIAIVLLVVVFNWLEQSDCNPAVQNCANPGLRTTGGSWGGYSSGGSHK